MSEAEPDLLALYSRASQEAFRLEGPVGSSSEKTTPRITAR
jgi:hypothetical protein